MQYNIVKYFGGERFLIDPFPLVTYTLVIAWNGYRSVLKLKFGIGKMLLPIIFLLRHISYLVL